MKIFNRDKIKSRHASKVVKELATKCVKMEEDFIMLCLKENSLPEDSLKMGHVSMREIINETTTDVIIYHSKLPPDKPIGVYSKLVNMKTREFTMQTAVLKGNMITSTGENESNE
jgi:hypothetical protein